MTIRDLLARPALLAAESGRLPEAVLRRGVRAVVAGRARELARGGPQIWANREAAMVRSMREAPVAVATDAANEQHYEVPPPFFDLALGTRRKYSCAWWGPGVDDLDSAERAMLDLVAERAQLTDGQRILDLGSGWGSFSLYAAARYPQARITAVSNSHAQRDDVAKRAAQLGLDNLEVLVGDANDLEFPPGSFDRVVSVEMFEHLRNWPAMLARIRSWLTPEGRAFVHVFCHRDVPYPFEDRGPGDWMAREFFTGGIMPSDDLMLRFADDLSVEARWRIDGRHYARTARAWLANLDRRRDEALVVFAADHGRRGARRQVARWRLFFLACEELFGFRDGAEWWVAHYRLAPRG
jgi:cyclopropane-fatty-acyl-phospholipid synthase